MSIQRTRKYQASVDHIEVESISIKMNSATVEPLEFNPTHHATTLRGIFPTFAAIGILVIYLYIFAINEQIFGWVALLCIIPMLVLLILFGWFMWRLQRKNDASAQQSTLRLYDDRLEWQTPVQSRTMSWSSIQSADVVHQNKRVSEIQLRAGLLQDTVELKGFTEIGEIWAFIEPKLPSNAKLVESNAYSAPTYFWLIIIGFSIALPLSYLLFVPLDTFSTLFLTAPVVIWAFRSLWWRFEAKKRWQQAFARGLIVTVGLILPLLLFFDLDDALPGNVCSLTNRSRLWSECVAVYEVDNFALFQKDRPMLMLGDWRRAAIRPITPRLSRQTWLPPTSLKIADELGLSRTPSGRYVAAETGRDLMTLWDSDNWEEITTFPKPHPAAAIRSKNWAVSWLDETHYFDLIEATNELVVVNAENGERGRRFLYRILEAISADGSHFVLSNLDEDQHIVFQRDAEQPIATIDYPSRYAPIAIAPNSRYVVFCDENSVMIYDIETTQRQTLATNLVDTRDCQMTFSANSTILYVGSETDENVDVAIHAIRLETRSELIETLELDGIDRLERMEISADDRYLILATSRRTFVLNNPFRDN